MKQYIFIFMLIMGQFAFAQKNANNRNSYQWSLGVNTGATTYYGDLNYKWNLPNRNDFRNVVSGGNARFVGFSLENQFSSALGIVLNGNYGNVTGNDRTYTWKGDLQPENPAFARSLNFRTEFYDADISLVYHFANGFLIRKNARFAPYISVGAGMTHFFVFGDLYTNSGDRYHYWSDNTIRTAPENGPNGADVPVISQDGQYETRLSNYKIEGVDYALWALNLPVSLGTKIRVSDRWEAGIQVTAKYLFTDYFDDVAGKYSNDHAYDAQAAYILNPNPRVWDVTKQEYRGNANGQNDIYALASVGLNYRFGMKIKKMRGLRLYSDYKPITPSSTPTSAMPSVVPAPVVAGTAVTPSQPKIGNVGVPTPANDKPVSAPVVTNANPSTAISTNEKPVASAVTTTPASTAISTNEKPVASAVTTTPPSTAISTNEKPVASAVTTTPPSTAISTNEKPVASSNNTNVSTTPPAFVKTIEKDIEAQESQILGLEQRILELERRKDTVGIARLKREKEEAKMQKEWMKMQRKFYAEEAQQMQLEIAALNRKVEALNKQSATPQLAPVVNAVPSNQAEVESLKGEMATLKAEIEALRKQMSLQPSVAAPQPIIVNTPQPASAPATVFVPTPAPNTQPQLDKMVSSLELMNKNLELMGEKIKNLEAQKSAPQVVYTPAPAPAQPIVVNTPAAPTPTTQYVEVGVSKVSVFFANGSTEILGKDYATLDAVINTLQKDLNMSVLLTGFASKTGNASLNARLSQQRAQNVSQYLIQRGISPSRIRTESMGASTLYNSSLDRRVEITILGR